MSNIATAVTTLNNAPAPQPEGGGAGGGFSPISLATTKYSQTSQIGRDTVVIAAPRTTGAYTQQHDTTSHKQTLRAWGCIIIHISAHSPVTSFKFSNTQFSPSSAAPRPYHGCPATHRRVSMRDTSPSSTSTSSIPDIEELRAVDRNPASRQHMTSRVRSFHVTETLVSQAQKHLLWLPNATAASNQSSLST